MEFMDYAIYMLFSLFFFICIYVATIRSHRRVGINRRLPPGPNVFSFMKSIIKLGNKPHESCAVFSKRYGPLMTLKLGTKTTIVASSPDIVKEFIYTKDRSFSGRPVPDISRVADHYKSSLVLLPTGDKWAKLRRMTKEYVFSVQRLEVSEIVRMEKVQELIDHVNQCCTDRKLVQIGDIVFTTILNILSNIFFSMDLARYDSVSSQEFKDMMGAFMGICEKPSIVDYFPILRALDPQGLVRRGKVYFNKLLTFSDKIIDQRLQTRLNSSSYNVTASSNDVLDLLLNNLDQKDECEFNRSDIIHLFLDLFFAGTETTSSALEWAMAELIHNPEKMTRARVEVSEILKNDNRNLKESDISRLPYLSAIIKETLRLYPPLAFLGPRKAIHDVAVQGFIMPKNAEILCNVWAMGRDPDIWSDPKVFKPERFLNVNIDYKGQDFEFIPFGSGRRICPGLNIAHKMLHIILGSLIYMFDWKLAGNTSAQDMDMEGKIGITLQKKVPLMAIPIRL
ncbi:cytochrome P450 76AD1-like [Cynara cardunculus var. scolymus]|uniref:Cytochrome P450 n=1 Tax=Cynara cardunculus var. scolymus TaxID=59895 RepID=A0A103XEC4_CYNCS|nr:cytochrome P450 76AD1-like [Cynara cardunculus var. scolymus]KVH89153.1 cytochrome P450 [Cynara cardunculus var. scolymus]